MSPTEVDTSHLENALLTTVQQAIEFISVELRNRVVAQLTWKRGANGGWVGSYEYRPELVSAVANLSQNDFLLDRIQADFDRHLPGIVGCTIRIGGLGGTSCRPYDVLHGILDPIWDRHGTFNVEENVIRAVVRELLHGVQSHTVSLAYLAPIRNFNLAESTTTTFPNGVTIRRLQDREATRLYGGLFPALKTSFGPPGDFAFAGQLERPFTVGAEDPDASEPIRLSIRGLIQTAEEVLMAIKPGAVVHDWISVSYGRASPSGTLIMGIDSASRPAADRYELTKREAALAIERFAVIANPSFTGLSTACKRLADSERRTEPADALVDAVIGLESLLLAGKDREGLRFRFALNYATLEPSVSPSDRRSRFRLASDVYKVRSQLVHTGTSRDTQYRVAGAVLDISGVAAKAREMLRSTIHLFLALEIPHQANARERWFESFWEDGYFRER